MFRILRTTIIIFRIYKYSSVSKNNLAKLCTENDLLNQKTNTCINKRKGRASQPHNIKRAKIKISDMEIHSEEATEFFRMAKKRIKIYRPIAVKYFMAKKEKKGIKTTFDELKWALFARKNIRWKNIQNKSILGPDQVRDQRLYDCRAKINEALQKIHKLIEKLKSNYVYFQLDNKQKSEFLNFTSDSWCGKFNQMIKDTFGNEFAQKLEDTIKEFRVYREDLWQKYSFADESLWRQDVLEKEISDCISKDHDYTNRKFLLIRGLSGIKNTENMLFNLNHQKKIALMPMFSNKQKANFFEKYYEMRTEFIYRKEAIEKKLCCLDYAEGIKMFDQDIMYGKKEYNKTNEELDKNIADYLKSHWPSFPTKYLWTTIYSELELKQIYELSFDIKCKLADKLKIIIEQTFIEISTLEKEYNQEKELAMYKNMRERREMLDYRIKLIKEYKEDSEYFCRSEKKLIYIERLINISDIDRNIAENIIKSIGYALNKPFVREKKIERAIKEMKKISCSSFCDIFQGTCNQTKVNKEKACSNLPNINFFQEEYITKNQMLVDFTEQLVLENLKNLKNLFKMGYFKDKNLEIYIKIIECNLKFKSPIFVEEEIFELTNEVKKIIYEILMNDILNIERNTRGIFEVLENRETNVHNTDLMIVQLAKNDVLNVNNVENLKETYYYKLSDKWNAQLAVYWAVIYDNTAISCYKTYKYNVENSFLSMNEAFLYFDDDLLLNFKKNELELKKTIRVRSEIAFIWFFIYLRTYTCYVVDVFLGFSIIPMEKLDQLLLEYNNWENFAKSSLFWNLSDLYTTSQSFMLDKKSKILRADTNRYVNKFIDELELLLYDSIVTEEFGLCD